MKARTRARRLHRLLRTTTIPWSRRNIPTTRTATTKTSISDGFPWPKLRRTEWRMYATAKHIDLQNSREFRGGTTQKRRCVHRNGRNLELSRWHKLANQSAYSRIKSLSERNANGAFCLRGNDVGDSLRKPRLPQDHKIFLLRTPFFKWGTAIGYSRHPIFCLHSSNNSLLQFRHLPGANESHVRASKSNRIESNESNYFVRKRTDE